MKIHFCFHFFFTSLIFLFFTAQINRLEAQNCTLTGSTSGELFTQAQVVSCLNTGMNPCPCVITITGGKVELDGDWNLASLGVIKINITATGELIFGQNEDLILSAGSVITIATGGKISTLGMAIIRITFMHTPNVTYTDLDITNILLVQGGVAGPLPVELSSFEGKLDHQTVALTWQTSAELNNDKFIIETSTEGEVFQRIGEIDGAGTTTETHNYQFTHHTPSAGVNYYRLKQVDFDGTFAYSKVLAIDAPGSQDIFAFPNPAKDKITLQYDYSKGAGNIQLYDALGRRINATIAGYPGNYEVKLPEGLAKGTYWLKVERGGKVQTVAMVKE